MTTEQPQPERTDPRHVRPLERPIGAADPGTDPGHPPGTHPAPGQRTDNDDRDAGEMADRDRHPATPPNGSRVARSQLQAGGDDGHVDRATVVIHVKADDLVDGDATATGETGSGLPVAIDRVGRRCCDARYQHVRVDAPDRPLGIGRVAQTVPPWLRRLVRRRDRGCRFPGCGRTRLVHAHHIRWWSAGGPTDLDNLVSVCTFHHRLVHEGGWRLHGHPDEQLVWTRPDGTPLATGPQRRR